MKRGYRAARSRHSIARTALRTRQRGAMQLLAAARVEELRAQAAALAPEMERHQVPAEYLANRELAQALQTAHSAKTPAAVAAADATVQECLFLIGKDGIKGPDIDQLRKETTANVNGAGDSHFEDPAFVKAAKDMHGAKLLAEGGFTGSERTPVEQRYERAEKELFARMEGLGREIEHGVTGNDSSRLKDHGLKAETASAASYGSAAHHEKSAESLEDSGANGTQIRGLLAAARSEGTHPIAAVNLGKRAAKARKTRTGPAVAVERGKSGLSRSITRSRTRFASISQMRHAPHFASTIHESRRTIEFVVNSVHNPCLRVPVTAGNGCLRDGAPWRRETCSGLSPSVLRFRRRWTIRVGW